MTFNPMAIAGLLISLLAGTGALSFFFRYGVRLALVEKLAAEAHEDAKQNGKDIAVTRERISVVENTLQDIANSLSTLNSTLRNTFKDMVSRPEHVARWQAQEERMADIKEQLVEIREGMKSR